MKVIHVTTTDYGGAYRAAQNISISMRLYGIDSSVLVRERHSDEDCTPYFYGGIPLFMSRAKNLLNLALSKRHGQIVNDLFGTDITDHPKLKDADIIFLHWVNSFVSYSVLRKIVSLGKPVFWVLHDMWPFTGGCHYDNGCSGYINACESGCGCRIPKGKSSAWEDAPIVFVGPSKWMMQCAMNSALLSKHKCINIANPVDTDLFKPVTGSTRVGKKRIVFSAMDPSDKRKGWDLLVKSLERLSVEDYDILVMGARDRIDPKSIKMRIECLGDLKEPKDVSKAYADADIAVIPSREENLSNSVLEALSCGKPVVAFDIGGMSDMIVHKENGYLADPFDTEDFAKGIEYCAVHLEEMGVAARKTAMERYSMDVIGKQYANLCINFAEGSCN